MGVLDVGSRHLRAAFRRLERRRLRTFVPARTRRNPRAIGQVAIEAENVDIGRRWT